VISHPLLPLAETERTEPATVDPRFTALLFGGIAALVVTSLVVTWCLYVAWSGPEIVRNESGYRPANVPLNAAPLSVNQREERLHYEAGQRELLSTYAWIDSKNGIARIPIEQAMQRLVKREEGQK
jgi:hypothetical protein